MNISRGDICFGQVPLPPQAACELVFTWIDAERECLCFADRTFRLDMLSAGERAMLSRLAWLYEYATAREYMAAVDRELTPLISRLCRYSTN